MAGFVAGGAIGARSLAGPSAQALPSPQRLTSVDIVGGTPGSKPSVSGDGRFVVYEGLPGADDLPANIYVQDRESGTVTELVHPLPDTRPGHSVNPVISRDGCVVAMNTELPLDLFRDDDAGDRWDVYRLTLPHCDGSLDDWELVSSLGPQAGGRDDVLPEFQPAISTSGAVIAYVHPAPGMSPDLGINAITVVDLTVPVTESKRYVLAAGLPFDMPETAFRYRGLDQPALSGDGRYLAFRADSIASDAVPGWADGPTPGEFATAQVYVWDRGNDDPFRAVRLVSGRFERMSASGASDPAISEDGSVVVFVSPSNDLTSDTPTPCVGTCPAQVYRLDRDLDDNGVFDEPNPDDLTIVSSIPNSSPVESGSGDSTQPAVNADGSLVAFVTHATNLLPVRAPGGGAPDDGDLLVADALNHTLRRVTTTPGGLRPAVGAHSHPQMSDTGRVLVIDSLVAGQLVGESGAPGRHVVALTALPQLNMASVDLGVVMVGFPGPEWYTAVVNEGPTAFLPMEVEISNPQFTVTGGTCTKPVVVPAGGDCTIYMVLNPTVGGPIAARLTVSEAGFEPLSISTSIHGTGGEPALSANPSGLDLPSTVVGETSSTRSFDVRNVSFTPTGVGSLRIFGANADDFEVESNSCVNRPLNPGSTCGVDVVFTPSAAGRRTATLYASTAAGQYATVVLAGDGRYEPRIELMSSRVEAGTSIGIGGSGFPAVQYVTLVFADSWGRSIVVGSNESGKFLAEMKLPAGERPGHRVLVAQTPDGVSTSIEVEIVRSGGRQTGRPGFGLG